VTSRPCPACGAAVPFRSAAPYAVCSYCHSLLVRRDATLENVGRVAEVPDDFSPLQLNTGGWFDGRRFTLIGRLRKAWEQGSWSEWCAMFDDMRLGWLAEAQGELVMTFERPLESAAPLPTAAVLRGVAPGAAFTIEGHSFTASDVKDVTCVGAEGELISCPAPGSSMRSVDLHGPGLEFATLELGGEHIDLFAGRYVEFSECRFTGLRTLAGWAPATR
jgi:hypothetical protein